MSIWKEDLGDKEGPQSDVPASWIQRRRYSNHLCSTTNVSHMSRYPTLSESTSRHESECDSTYNFSHSKRWHRTTWSHKSHKWFWVELDGTEKESPDSKYIVLSFHNTSNYHRVRQIRLIIRLWELAGPSKFFDLLKSAGQYFSFSISTGPGQFFTRSWIFRILYTGVFTGPKLTSSFNQGVYKIQKSFLLGILFLQP